MDVVLLAKLEELPLRVLGVQLDLIGSWDRAGRLHQLFKVGDRKVGDTNRLGLAGLDKVFHGLVRVSKVNIGNDDLSVLLGDCLWTRSEGDGPVLG